MNLGDFHRAVDEFVSDRGTHPAYVVMDRTTADLVITGPARMVAVGTPGEEILRP